VVSATDPRNSIIRVGNSKFCQGCKVSEKLLNCLTVYKLSRIWAAYIASEWLRTHRNWRALFLQLNISSLCGLLPIFSISSFPPPPSNLILFYFELLMFDFPSRREKCLSNQNTIRSRSQVTREGQAEEGGVEIGETGLPNRDPNYRVIWYMRNGPSLSCRFHFMPFPLLRSHMRLKTSREQMLCEGGLQTASFVG
jgi:hypothetical protein